MKKIGRKFWKLVRSPNDFWRDFFIKRSPIDYKNGVGSLPAEGGKLTIQSRHDDAEFVSIDPNVINFPIDIVYTWVDGDDEIFIKIKRLHEDDSKSKKIDIKREIYDEARFVSRDELKFSLRSVEKYAPWINHIYIVTNGQVPKWLDLNNEKVTLVTHDQIIPNEFLPTFNSHVIESCLHRIQGLSQHYLYLNDDVMFTRPVKPSYFFTSSGLAKVFITNSLLNASKKTIYDTPTQWAAKNAREFLWNQYGVFSSNLFAHTFHPQVKKSCVEIEEILGDELNKIRKNKFRSKDDMPFATFLHHHYALLKGYAVATHTSCMYFNVRNPKALISYKSLLARKDKNTAPWSMCLNDHVSSGVVVLEDYVMHLQGFLSSYYSIPSLYEIYVDEPDSNLQKVCKNIPYSVGNN